MEEYSEEDLLTEQEIIDRLVQAVTEDDLVTVVYWIKKLEKNDWLQSINDGHSSTSMSPLVAAGTKGEQTRTRSLILRVLRAKGATLPSPNADTPWLDLLRGWAIELVETSANPEDQDEKDAAYLLSTSDNGVDNWVASNLPHPEADSDVHNHNDYRSHSLPVDSSTSRSSYVAPRGYTPLEGGSSGSSNKRDWGYSSPLVHGEKPIIKIKGESREETLPPVEHENLGFIDLTDSRSPSPVLPKPEPNDDDENDRNVLHHQSGSRVDKGKGRARDNEDDDDESSRTHLRIDNLPLRFTDEDLHSLVSDLPGIIEASIRSRSNDSSWAMVTFDNVDNARKGHREKKGKMAPGGVRGMEVKLYSSQGVPIEAEEGGVQSQQQLSGQEVTGDHEFPNPGVVPSNGNGGGGIGPERWTMGFSGGGQSNGANGGGYGAPLNNGGGGFGHRGGFFNGGPPGGGFFPGRFMNRPRTPFHFTAAELARRVYLGGLPFGITGEEVDRIFREQAKVKARVLKVMNAPDGSHSFAIVQHPDSITADFAIKTLHGQVYDAHLLQLEHVNELAHRWLYSLTLHGFPRQWQYRDVSDFLISTIGSFAGLRVSHPQGPMGEVSVRVELRYETELKWAANELNGLIVAEREIRAVVDQPGIRRKMEREMAYEALQQKVNTTTANSNEDGYNPYDPSTSASTSTTYDPNYPSTSTHSSTTMVSNGAGGGSRTRPAPPPPPPPPAKRTKTESSSVTGYDVNGGGAGSSSSGVSAMVTEPANPFSPLWLKGK